MSKLDEHAQAVDVRQRRTEAKALTLGAAGDNTMHAPESGKFILLEYVCLSADEGNTAGVTAIVKWSGGKILYKVSLVPGAIWARNIGAGKKVLTGTADEQLVVQLSSAQSVHASIEYEEY